jgi:hypothetical protein
MLSTFQTDIFNYLKTLSVTKKPNKWVLNEYPDTDVYKDSITVYVNFPDMDFEEADTERFIMTGFIEIYCIFQKDTQDKLKDLCLDYADGFFTLVKDNPSLGNAVDYSIVSNIKIYDGVEGATNMRGISVKIEYGTQF